MVGAAILPSAAAPWAYPPSGVGPSVRRGSASSSLFAPVIASAGRIASPPAVDLPSAETPVSPSPLPLVAADLASADLRL